VQPSADGPARLAEQSHALQTQRLARALASRPVAPGDPFPCPYLAGRTARQLTLVPRPLAPGVYHALMDLNFRRLGPLFYRPQCALCDECRMIRLPVAQFRPSRAQRRCRVRNQDVVVNAGRPSPSAEKHALYQRYLASRHDGQMDGSDLEFHGFLYSSEIRTLEVEYRVEGRLLGVALVDREPLALSAVYCYFDPAGSRRSPGVFNVLWLIDECRRLELRYLYLGYYVAGSGTMSYKASYRPCEVLQPDGRWAPLPSGRAFGG
jgi:arginine-tRNA-protein transferase